MNRALEKWDNIKCTNICVMGTPQGEKKGKKNKIF